MMKQAGRARLESVLEPVLDKVADHLEVARIEHPSGRITVTESYQDLALKCRHLEASAYSEAASSRDTVQTGTTVRRTRIIFYGQLQHHSDGALTRPPIPHRFQYVRCS